MSDCSDYDPKFNQMLIKFFSVAPYTEETDARGNKIRWASDPLTIKRFAQSIGKISRTLKDWREAEKADGTPKYPEWRDLYDWALEVSENNFIVQTAHGIFNSTFAGVFAANYFDWKTSKEQKESKHDATPAFAAALKGISQVSDEQAHDYYAKMIKDSQ